MLAGFVLLIFSIGMTKKYRENPLKSKVWFSCAVIGIVVVVICIIKLMI